MSRADIYCFHFVSRQELIAYCALLLLPPTGANLFRFNSSVVSFMLLGKKTGGDIFCEFVRLLNKISLRHCLRKWQIEHRQLDVEVFRRII